MDYRTRAALRRIAAGEQRKRAMRLSEALRDDAFSLRYLPRQRLAGANDGHDHRTGGGADHRTSGGADHRTSGGADHRTGGGADHRTSGGADHLAGAELWIGLPNRRRGLVSVAPFLRDLEKPLLRDEMLRFALHAAAAEVALWPETWRVAVPVPARTLADGAVVDTLLAASDHAGLARGRIDVQIDESELVEGGGGLHHALGALRDHGIGVILEGFGALFGSLALLPRLPLTGLKLDRRLAHAGVTDDAADETTLILASVAIAHRLGVPVTIDGIETEAEMERTRRLGVDLVQGPWIGPAMAAEAIRARARAG